MAGYDNDILRQLVKIEPGPLRGTWVFDYGKVQVIYNRDTDFYHADGELDYGGGDNYPVTFYVDFTQRMFRIGDIPKDDPVKGVDSKTLPGVATQIDK